MFGFGGTAPYTFTVQSGTLPPGVTLQSPGESLGAFLGPGFYYLAGRAMQVGDYSFTLAVTDAANATVTKAFSWVITPIAHQYFSLPISGTPLVYNTAYTQPLLAIGGDAVGRKRSITDPLGHTTQVTYDGAGRLLTTTDPLTHFVAHLYDANGNRTQTTDARGGVTAFAYDANNLLTTAKDALAGVTQHAYDALDRRLTTTDARGQITTFAYDAEGRLTQTTDPTGGIVRIAVSFRQGCMT